MHLHDNDGKNDNHMLPLHRNGTIDWRKKVSDLKKTSLFNRMITLEANIEGDNLTEGFSAALSSAKKLAEL